jgi:hypothetical protein
MNLKLTILIVALLLIPKTTYAATDLSGIYAFGVVKSLGDLISYLVPTALIIGGLIVAYFFFTATFDMIISQGDKNAIAAARNKMVHAVIGLILLIVSFVAVRVLPYLLFGSQPFNIF